MSVTDNIIHYIEENVWFCKNIGFVFSSALVRRFESAALWGDTEEIFHLKLNIHVLVLNCVTTQHH